MELLNWLLHRNRASCNHSFDKKVARIVLDCSPFFPTVVKLRGEKSLRMLVAETRRPRKREARRKVEEEEESTPEAAGQALLKILQKGGPPPADNDTVEPESILASSEGLDALFMTDKEITAKSQQAKSQSKSSAAAY